MAAVLVEAGRFMVVNWHDEPRDETRVAGEPRGPPTETRLTPAATRAAVEDASSLRLRNPGDLPPYHYGLVFERLPPVGTNGS